MVIGQLGMLGVTYRRGGQDAIERFSLPAGPAGDAALQRLHMSCGFTESVYINTCNRVELVFVGDGKTGVDTYRLRLHQFFSCDGAAVGDVESARRGLHAYSGEGAAEHLFCVAAALDSMNPGEAQILGQVKRAFQRAVVVGTVGPVLRQLFADTFSVAKRVRSTTALGQCAVSMVSLAADAMEQRLIDRSAASVVVVGTGAMSEQCAALFSGRSNVDLLFVNRTMPKAETLVRRFGGRAVALDQFVAAPPPFDVMLTSIGATPQLFDAGFMARLAPALEGHPAPLLVDLGVPRDVDRVAAARLGACCVDVDALAEIGRQNRDRRQAAMAEARVLVDEALDTYRRRAVERAMGPSVKRFRRVQREAFLAAWARFPHEVGEHMQPWVEQAINRLAHGATVALKQLALTHGSEAVECFLDALEEAEPAIESDEAGCCAPQGARDWLGADRLDGTSSCK